MEQKSPRKTTPKVLAQLIMTCVAPCAIFVACKSQEPNPETLDPIYSDLVMEQKKAESGAAETRKKMEETEAKLKTLKYPDLNIISNKKDLAISKAQLLKQEQAAKYFQIRAEQRKDYDHQDYLAAYRADKPWPDPHDYEEYKRRKSLRNASPNWGERVPKLTRYNKPAVVSPKEKPEKPPEEGAKKE